MPTPSLPDFEVTLRLAQGNLDAAELAECHGFLCGLLCRGLAADPGEYLQQLAAMNLVVHPGEALASTLADLRESTAAQLRDESLGFHLWLPDDDEPLEDRTVALARWCSGYLAGLGSGGDLGQLSDESREALDDLQQIARAELSAPNGGENEEDEQAYTEIVEYVRIVVLMMCEDFRGPASGEAVH